MRVLETHLSLMRLCLQHLASFILFMQTQNNTATPPKYSKPLQQSNKQSLYKRVQQLEKKVHLQSGLLKIIIQQYSVDIAERDRINGSFNQEAYIKLHTTISNISKILKLK